MPLRVLLLLESSQIGLGYGGGFEHSQQRTYSRPDTGLGVRVEGQLPPGVGLLADRANRGPGLHRSV